MSLETAPQTTSASAGVTTDAVTFAGSGLVFDNTFEASVTAAYKTCIIDAEQALSSEFRNSVTIDETFQAQAEGQTGDLASNSFFTYGPVSYAQLKSALTTLSSQESNPILTQAVASLPASDPSGGAGFQLPMSYADMLGLTTETAQDTVTLNTSYNWSYGQDVINTLEHEISEGGMGRIGGLGDQNSLWSMMDLFRFNSSGKRDYTDGRDGRTTFFSYNGGATLSSLSFDNDYNSNGTFNNGGDVADFIQQDIFGTGTPGETNKLSATDIQMMEALGWSVDVPPSVTAQSFVVLKATPVAISNDFSVSNPSNDTIADYVFDDEGGGSGYFSVDGIRQADNKVISVAASDLGDVDYVGGSSPSTDKLKVGVVDGTTGSTFWSAVVTAKTGAIIQTDGSTSLEQVANTYFLYADGTTTGPELKYNGAAVVTGEFAGWNPIGAVAVSGGDYDLAWESPSTHQFKVWSLNGSGAFLANISGGTVSANTYTLESLETIFGQDLNGDSTIGLVSTTIKTDGSISLTQVANRFYLEDGGTPTEIQYSGTPLTVGEFGGWTPIGAVQVASGGYDLAWKLPSANQYKVWSLNSAGAFTANISGGTVGPGNITLETLELTFDQDLNGDGKIGPTAATIGAGKTLEIASPYAGKVTFQGSTGKLLLDISSSFSGTVVGMKGSDTLDLAMIDPTTVQTPTYHGTISGGTLSVTDGTHSATIALLGNYLASTFVASADGHGGTNIVDPALVAANTQTVAPSHHA